MNGQEGQKTNPAFAYLVELIGKGDQIYIDVDYTSLALSDPNLPPHRLVRWLRGHLLRKFPVPSKK